MNICFECLGDPSLRELVSDSTHDEPCSYCNESSISVPLGSLVEPVSEALQTYCTPGEEYGVPDLDSEHMEYRQYGEPLWDVLQLECEIDYRAAMNLMELLIESERSGWYSGEPLFFHQVGNYHRKPFTSGEYRFTWEEFSERLKHKSRFFDEDAKDSLAMILGAPESPEAAELPVFEVGPSSDVDIYRARLANSQEHAKAILGNPQGELGPPSPHKVSSGRMNPAGIPVFYGALSSEVAVAEVRPSVGSVVIVGRFQPNNPFRLLDLSRIGISFSGSLFSPEYEERASRVRFLKEFHNLIAKPIRPEEEDLEYLPTQAVAEYVRNILGFDGILYASAQVGATPEPPELPPHGSFSERDIEVEQHNVVLFDWENLAVIPDSLRCMEVTGLSHSTDDITFFLSR